MVIPHRYIDLSFHLFFYNCVVLLQHVIVVFLFQCVVVLSQYACFVFRHFLAAFISMGDSDRQNISDQRQHMKSMVINML